MSLVEVHDVHKTFPSRQRGGDPVHALRGVSLTVDEGETLAIIGESGSGKSTLGRAVLRLLDVDSGTVSFDGKDLGAMDRKQLRAQRAEMQIVFQEPFESLNPRMSIGAIVAEPLQIHRPDLGTAETRRQVRDALHRVGLPADAATRLPGELSGGQQQRVGVARAIVSRPRFVVLDEPTSSLDLSIRAQILALLAELQEDLGLAYLFVSHDMHTVEWVSDRVAVMYLGRFVETRPTAELFADPHHAYSKTLLSARLSADPREKHAYKAFPGDEDVVAVRAEGA
ncbi:ABC transporter ATP-binding protein [Nocardioides sp. TF02-7]|uniref:ATP-binding cassette domain-containing protein n=1 Tax=Nocardioides sp. TF02-7 TaxID=2917724 RepID=UPI001F06D7A1|nr:ABC transporter ATP-binding protein [Nocardioides sp. TF02-7]UMG93706.1 ATP-binding cassette domain-containing protein [Nocardioides sp. TF02-7]